MNEHLKQYTMKAIIKIVALSALSIFMFVPLQDTNAAKTSLDKLSGNLNEHFATGNSSTNPLPNEAGEIKLTFSPSSGDAVALPVGRDAIVFVAESKHPNLEALRTNGISFEWIRQQLATGGNSIVVTNEFVLERLINFLNMKSEDIQPHSILNAPKTAGIISVILISELRQETAGSDYMLIPIDRNGNGSLETNESFYATYDEFSRAVWLGKYPKALSLTLYAEVPASKLHDSEFIKWFYSEGLSLVSANGFMPLNSHEIAAYASRLTATSERAFEAEASSVIPVWLIIIVALAATAVLVFFVFLSVTKPHQPLHETTIKADAFGANSFSFAKGRLYDKTHAWAFREENGLVKIGFDDFINKLFGNQAELKLLNNGERFIKGDVMATIHHLGRKVEVKAPVSGKIVTINQSIANQNQVISLDWVYKIEPDNWTREQGFLFIAEQHKEWLAAEFLRFREFLANATRASKQDTQLIMLDGGELIEGVMQYVEPQVWEDFQRSFMQVNA